MIAWLWKALAVAVSVGIADVFWARYTQALADGRMAAAAASSAAIVGLGSVTIFAYVNDASMVVPAMIGAYLGTAVGMRVGVRK